MDTLEWGELRAAPWRLENHRRERADREQLFAWRRIYTLSAAHPDWLIVHRWWYDERIARNTTEDLREKLQLAPGQSLLEVGCASGIGLARILPENGRGVGLDHCEAVLRRGRDFGVSSSGTKLAAADASRLPIGSSAFDRVFAYSVFQCFPNHVYAIRVIAEMIRVCKPGGLVFIGDVFGELETPLRFLRRAGVRGDVADALLKPLLPMRDVLVRWTGRKARPQRRTYPRAFFRALCRRWGNDLEILEQSIPERRVSRSRFDVRIRKR